MQDVTHAWTVRVRADGPDAATAHARRHALRLGSPAAYGVEAPLPSAVEALLGALGADLLATVAATARRRRVVIDALEAALHCTLDNPLVQLGVIGERGSPRIDRIDVTLYLSTDLDGDGLTRLWEAARDRSPLHATLERSVALTVRLCPTP